MCWGSLRGCVGAEIAAAQSNLQLVESFAVENGEVGEKESSVYGMRLSAEPESKHLRCGRICEGLAYTQIRVLEFSALISYVDGTEGSSYRSFA